MSTFKDRLNKIRQTHDYRLEKVKLEFVKGITRVMRLKGVNNAELARLLDTSPSYATKIMRGDCNFTLDSMVKITHSLGSTLHVHVADQRASVRWLEAFDSARLADNVSTQKSRKVVERKEAINPLPALQERDNEACRVYA